MNRQKAKLQGKEVGVMDNWLDMFHKRHVQIQPGRIPNPSLLFLPNNSEYGSQRFSRHLGKFECSFSLKL